MASFASGKVIFERLKKALVEEELGLDGLTDADVEVYAALADEESVKRRTNRFGFHSRPADASGRVGHFISTRLDKEVEEAGHPSYDWRYWKSNGYWLQMSKLAMEREFKASSEGVGGLSGDETLRAVWAWGHVFRELARGINADPSTFYCIATDSGLVRATAAAKELEGYSQTSIYKSKHMEEASSKFSAYYTKQAMKQEAASKAAADIAARASRRSASGGN